MAPTENSATRTYGLLKNRGLENQLKLLGGKKVLYAQSYYTKNEFWEIYDKNWYDNLRKKYLTKTVFPNIYEKIKVSHKYKTSLFRGAVKYITPPYRLRIEK